MALKKLSLNPKDYKLLEEVGYGASATVFRAIYLPTNEVVAVKSLDLDRCNSNLDDIRREAQTMSLIDHPNIIKSFCSFVVDHNLWVVMPYMAEGSCLHLMKTAYPEGFEESAIVTILKETLKALEYLHKQGHIHRDVKAGNILLDSGGEVKLGDFGVSACMFDRGDRQRSRNTFVGTPCWMAPEVLQPGTGYDFKADIWSFGITALELAHGHAPFSKYPPMKVLLMTIQNAPPGLDYDRDKRFSKSFKEMVAMCLVKDQTKRPTAEKLLKHSFFKNAKPPQISLKKLFADLPPLWKRVKDLQLKDAAQLALKQMPSTEQEAISHSEYQRGVSAWNFDVEDLKFQASLLQEADEIEGITEEEDKYYTNQKVAYSSEVKWLAASNDSDRDKTNDNEVPTVESQINPAKSELAPSMVEKGAAAQPKTRVVQASRPRQTQSGPLMPGTLLSHSMSERARNLERFDIENQHVAEKPQQSRRSPSLSGPLNLPTRASANSLSAPIKSSGAFKDTLDEKSKASLVQIKGRFSVTSENVDLVKPHIPSSKEIGANSNLPASVLMPHLQNLFQQTSLQQDLIMNLLSSLQPAEVENAPQNPKLPPLPRGFESNGNVEPAFTDRERLLLMKITELQTRMISLTDELTVEKVKHMELKQRLDAMSVRGDDGDGREGDS